MEKKIISFLFMVLVLLTMSTVSLAQKVETSLKINGDLVLLEKPILTEAGHHFIHTKDLANLLKMDIEWLNATKQLLVSSKTKQFIFKMGDKEVIVSGDKVSADAAPWIADGVSYVPLDLISSELGFHINYDQKGYVLNLTNQQFSLDNSMKNPNHYSEADLELLARIIDVEGGDRSLELKLAVANVVLNRVKSPKFPNTLREVIFHPGQFPPAHKSNFMTRNVRESSYIAAKKALEGVNNIGNCLYFNSRPFSSKAGDFYRKIQGEYFYE